MTGAELRVGVVGTGFGARVVAPVFASTDGCAVIDVVSARDAGAVAKLCARRDLDLISVHSPPFLHLEHVGLAVDGGHAVLCDKPFGRDAGEAATMLELAESARVVNLVNFEFRNHPVRMRLRDLVTSGAVGAVEHVEWTHMSAGSRAPLRPYGWLFDRARGGGWIGAWGSHAVDTIRWMLGEIVEASAETRVTIESRPDSEGAERSCDAEDAFTALLRLEHGASVAIDTTFAAAAPIRPRLAIAGEDAVIECVSDGSITLRRAGGVDEDHWLGEPVSLDHHLEPMQRWAAVVRDAVRQGSAPPEAPTFVDGLACARVLDALRHAPLSRFGVANPP